MKASASAPGIPTPLSAAELEEVSAELAQVTLARLSLEQEAKDASVAARKKIKEVKARQTELANERESGMRLVDRQQGLPFVGPGDDNGTIDLDEDDDIPPPAPAKPSKAKKSKGL